MAYEFECALCGFDEVYHAYPEERERSELSDESRKRGYPYSIGDCPDFQYKKKDEVEAAICILEDDSSRRYERVKELASFSKRAVEIARKRIDREWKKKGYPEGKPKAEFQKVEGRWGRSPEGGLI